MVQIKKVEKNVFFSALLCNLDGYALGTLVISFGTPDLSGHIENTPPLSSCAQSCIELVLSPTTTLSDVQEVLSKETELCNALRAVIDSDYHDHHGHPLSLNEGVSPDGVRELCHILAALAVKPMFAGDFSELLDGDHLWGHSVSCAIWTQILADTLNIPNTDELFIAGLLHDVGMVFLHRLEGSAYEEVMTTVKQSRRELDHVESERLGASHASVCGLLCAHWNLPDKIVDLVKDHHPEKPPDDPLRQLVITADQLTCNTAMVEFQWKSPSHLCEKLLAVQGMDIDKVVELIEIHSKSIYKQIYSITTFKIPA